MNSLAACSASQDGDDLLAQRARQGDRQAFAELLRRHYAHIHRLAFRWTGHPQEAEDATQEVCLKLARSIHTFRGEAGFATWLHRITLNTLHDRHAARPALEVALEGSGADTLPDPRSDPERGVFNALIRRCIRLLPEALRLAVLLVHGEGFTHRQAGEALTCAEGTVSWRLSEARRHLGQCLELEGKSRGRK